MLGSVNKRNIRHAILKAACTTIPKTILRLEEGDVVPFPKRNLPHVREINLSDQPAEVVPLSKQHRANARFQMIRDAAGAFKELHKALNYDHKHILNDHLSDFQRANEDQDLNLSPISSLARTHSYIHHNPPQYSTPAIHTAMGAAQRILTMFHNSEHFDNDEKHMVNLFGIHGLMEATVHDARYW